MPLHRATRTSALARGEVDGGGHRLMRLAPAARQMPGMG